MGLVFGVCYNTNFVINLGDCGLYDFIDWEGKGGLGKVK